MTSLATREHSPPLALPAPAPSSTLQEREAMSDTNATGDVESVDPKGMTLLQILSVTDQGRVASDLNATFDELTRELLSLDTNEGLRKSKGSLTIKIALEYEDGTVKLKLEHAVKTPKPPQRANVFWLMGSGRLAAENPRQMRMPFSDVPARRAVIVG